MTACWTVPACVMCFSQYLCVSVSADNDGVLDGLGMSRISISISVFQSQLVDNNGVFDGHGLCSVFQSVSPCFNLSRQ